MVKTKQQQQLDLADRIEKVIALIDEINREIESISANSPVAPRIVGLFVFGRKERVGLIGITNGNPPNRYLLRKKAILLVTNILERQEVKPF